MHAIAIRLLCLKNVDILDTHVLVLDMYGWATTVVCLGAGGFFAQNLYMRLTTGMFKNSRRMDGKTVLITGANTGIGKEAARDLAGRGARVILACRDMQKANEARDEIVSETGNDKVVVRKLDLASFASVRQFAKEIVETEERLDVLINNAGAGGLGETKTEDGLIVGMQINHFGPFLLTNLLVDLVKKSAPSRIIFVSSFGHKMAKFDLDNLNFEKKFNDTQVYCYSKLGNVLNANELSRRLAGTGVTANSLNPGVVHTDIWRNLPPLIHYITMCLLKTFFKSAVEGAQTTIYLAVSEEVEGVTGEYFVDCKKSTMSNAAKDEDLAKKLWEKSEEYVKQKPNPNQ